MIQPLPRKVVLVVDQGMRSDRDEHAARLKAQFRAASRWDGKSITPVQLVLCAVIGISLGYLSAAGILSIFKIPKIF